MYSDKLLLKPGQVHNAWSKPRALPQEIVQQFTNKTMHLKGVQLDIVHVDPVSGLETSAPLSWVYNHHHALLAGDTKTLWYIFNRSKGSDPLGPHGSKLEHAEQRRLHMPHGCMMNGAAMNDFLQDLRSATKGRMIASFGGASGAEFRGTSTDLPMPYASAAGNPESFSALIHFINMRGAPLPSQKRFECPCTSARKIDPQNGTVDGVKVMPFSCSLELLKQNNTGCSLSTYQGGYRCCEDGVFLTESMPGPDVPMDEFRAKFTISYYDELPGARPVFKPACCDATGNATHHGNIEYDVPQCAAGTAPELCEHMITAVQPFDISSRRHRNSSEKVDPNETLELVHAWGHQHVGALGMELYDENTGLLLCRTKPLYGTGNTPGNEAGFLVGIPPCVWGPPPLAPPPQIRRGDLLRTVARYNSTLPRHGVMSLWLMDAARLAPQTKLEMLV